MTDPNNVVSDPWGRRPTQDDTARQAPPAHPAPDAPQVFETSYGILSFHEVTDEMIDASFAPDASDDHDGRG